MLAHRGRVAGHAGGGEAGGGLFAVGGSKKLRAPPVRRGRSFSSKVGRQLQKPDRNRILATEAGRAASLLNVTGSRKQKLPKQRTAVGQGWSCSHELRLDRTCTLPHQEQPELWNWESSSCLQGARIVLGLTGGKESCFPAGERKTGWFLQNSMKETRESHLVLRTHVLYST